MFLPSSYVWLLPPGSSRLDQLPQDLLPLGRMPPEQAPPVREPTRQIPAHRPVHPPCGPLAPAHGLQGRREVVAATGAVVDRGEQLPCPGGATGHGIDQSRPLEDPG